MNSIYEAFRRPQYRSSTEHNYPNMDVTIVLQVETCMQIYIMGLEFLHVPLSFTPCLALGLSLIRFLPC
jgi:hypothetical protein